MSTPVRLSTLLDGITCECTDPSCRTHRGQSHCTYHSEHLLYRIDMHDESGTAMCDGCADDAFSSGLFTTRDDGIELDELVSSPATLYSMWKRAID